MDDHEVSVGGEEEVGEDGADEAEEDDEHPLQLATGFAENPPGRRERRTENWSSSLLPTSSILPSILLYLKKKSSSLTFRRWRRPRQEDTG